MRHPKLDETPYLSGKSPYGSLAQSGHGSPGGGYMIGGGGASLTGGGDWAGRGGLAGGGGGGDWATAGGGGGVIVLGGVASGGAATSWAVHSKVNASVCVVVVPLRFVEFTRDRL